MCCQILQVDLDSLAQWVTDWQIKFNVAKFDYSLHQQKLEQVQSAKYLGISITDSLNWGQHISEISNKATRAMAQFGLDT